MIRRWLLFIITNILVVATLGILLNLLGVRGYMTANGLDYQALLIFCLVWGMAGSFISLALSRIMAKMMMRIKIIDPKSAGEMTWLVMTVHDLARKAKLPAMPEVGIYDSAEVNAFATGPTKSRSLVAVSTGLLSGMSKDQIEGVLAHEVAHIQNGDMVTMTLIQGIVNAFTMFLARVISFAISQQVEEGKRHMVNFAVTLFLDIALGFLGYLVVAGFSRAREFRADKGSARLLGGPAKMKAALEALGRMHGLVDPTKNSLSTMKISGSEKSFMSLLSTHPPIPVRIAALNKV